METKYTEEACKKCLACARPGGINTANKRGMTRVLTASAIAPFTGSIGDPVRHRTMPTGRCNYVQARDLLLVISRKRDELFRSDRLDFSDFTFHTTRFYLCQTTESFGQFNFASCCPLRFCCSTFAEFRRTRVVYEGERCSRGTMRRIIVSHSRCNCISNVHRHSDIWNTSNEVQVFLGYFVSKYS